MATPDSIKAAREAVENIATQHGHVGQDKLQQIQPELRLEIEKALFSKDLIIGSSVITLAKNLYSSKARFVFELLQNADDNKYTKASSLGSKPFVSFRIFPRKIVVECNEDGFTQQNLEAICAVGQSSKTGAQGYIGEKGIDFKFVFMVAHKVHIQSGPFSFSFGHKPGDSGMGMISPMLEETSEELESPLTIITLHLQDTGD
ncbi:putative ino80 chromatin remodeling complex protein [Colletotrichum scovillei]|uniref:Ino80 chromatin remodeling complex protein n=1 Tax=Colletotrichum scovillei TaxID=1209932 RepID=A0A9P7U9A6_9PEZI|nr:putative ino80 chromatin remodeling complex protein [Colletotrichum scovillei]KAG7042294.1 putative ino80 chromatin remodeling complex protein [Colletotrichum scovillei]KAG7062326.1 putative ino80 chromatin remodeling complex protein [Colletotrichum scovillei]